MHSVFLCFEISRLVALGIHKLHSPLLIVGASNLERHQDSALSVIDNLLPEEGKA